MELCEDGGGGVARSLASARLSPEIATALFDAVCADVERMFWLDVLHSDLSPYNILWNGETYRTEMSPVRLTVASCNDVIF